MSEEITCPIIQEIQRDPPIPDSLNLQNDKPCNALAICNQYRKITPLDTGCLLRKLLY